LAIKKDVKAFNFIFYFSFLKPSNPLNWAAFSLLPLDIEAFVGYSNLRAIKLLVYRVLI
jgi:hypothetical protein